MSFIVNENFPDPIRPDTVGTISVSSKKSAMIPDTKAQFKAIASLEIFLLSKLCIYFGIELFIISEIYGSNL